MMDNLQMLVNFMIVPAFVITMNKVVPVHHKDQYYRDFVFVSSACLFTYSIIASLDKTISLISDCFTCSV